MNEIDNLIKKIPKALMPNTLKVFDRLCASAMDIPTAYLEGIAKEKRAETEGRLKLTQESTKQIADKMNISSEYVRTAGKKFAHRVVREQINVDKITENAIKELEKKDHENTDQMPHDKSNPSQKTINDDWLNNFEKEARYKSTEEMQILFSRILAGEIKHPESYSIKAVKTLGELDPTVAKLFKKLCSCASFISPPGFNHVIIDARVPSLGVNAGTNSLQRFGLSFSELNLLNEYGLIISDFNSWYNYQLCIWDKEKSFFYSSKKGGTRIFNEHYIKEKGCILPFYHQKQAWVLGPKEHCNIKTNLQIHGVCFSKVGRELSQIVDIEPKESYTKALKGYFHKMKLEMVPYLTKVHETLT